MIVALIQVPGCWSVIRLRNTFYGAALTVGCLWSINCGAAAADVPSLALSRAELHYKAALYRYYRKDYLTALTDLAHDQNASLTGAGATAELRAKSALLQGATYLALDMEPEAVELFQQVATARVAPAERNVALFHLGKLAYRDGDYAKARSYLVRVVGDFKAPLRQEWLSLKTNLAIREGDLNTAMELMSDFDKSSIWWRYGLFNIGVANLKRGRLDEGLPYLDKLISLRPKNLEQNGLRDRALTAAGYGYLGQEDYSRAESYFQQVPLDSPQAGRALLGYGLAQSKTQGMERALAAWLELSDLRPIGAAVQEAFLAVPYAYEQLGMDAQARSSLKKADYLLSKEISDIANLSRQLARGGLSALFSEGMSPGASAPWGHFIELLSGQQVQHYRQVQQSQRNLRRELEMRQERVEIYRELLQSKRNLLRGKVFADKTRSLSSRVTGLRSRKDALATTLAQARDQDRWLEYANADIQARWRDVVRAEERELRLAEEGAGTEGNLERIMRLQGVLAWEGKESAARWFDETEQGLRQLELATIKAEQHSVSLRTAHAQTVASLDRAIARLAALEPSLARQLVALDRTERSADESFRRFMLTQLRQEQDRLTRYQGQVRVVRARMLDEAEL